jgi:hypothetical protein
LAPTKSNVGTNVSANVIDQNRTEQNIYTQPEKVVTPKVDKQSDGFEQFYTEFKEHYPARDGLRKGIDTAAKEMARNTVKPSEYAQVIIAAQNYKARERYPVDPVRFFKSREYPAGLWREYVSVPALANATNGPPMSVNGNGSTPPEGYAWDKDERGCWLHLGRDPATGKYPYGADNAADVKRIHDERWQQYQKSRRTGAGAGAQQGAP